MLSFGVRVLTFVPEGVLLSYGRSQCAGYGNGIAPYVVLVLCDNRSGAVAYLHNIALYVFKKIIRSSVVLETGYAACVIIIVIIVEGSTADLDRTQFRRSSLLTRRAGCGH